MNPSIRRLAAAAAAAALLPAGALAQNNGKGGSSGTSASVDGVILIDQARAEAGGVTPGDEPGFPVTISRPGSYRLASDLVVADSNVTAIAITGDSVTLDLNGFTISGPVQCGENPVVISCAPSGTGRGIDVAASARHGGVRIANGAVRGFAHTGIYVLRVNGLIDDVRVMENGNDGIYASGAVIRSSVARRNGRSGFVGNGINLIASIGANNALYGIQGNFNSGVGNSVFYGNGWGDRAQGGAVSTSPNVCSGNVC